jgi:phenylalanyl-tRNA synthetase alpha subunit
MEEFFAKMGNKKLKFKPAFNPYTEVRHPTPGWVELIK